MTTRDRRLLVGLAALIAVLWLLGQVTPVHGDHPAPWSPPPSAIVSLTAAPGEQQDIERQVDARPYQGTLPGATPAPSNGDVMTSPAATPGLPRGTGAEADHEAPAVRRPPTRSAAALFFVGVGSNMGPGFGPTYLALPQGPGWVARLCGQAACLTRVSTDTGPERWTGRIADLNVADFERLSGQSWRMGLTTITVTLLRRAP